MRKDYIMRLIEQIGIVIAQVLKLKDKDGIEAAQIEMNKETRKRFGMDLDNLGLLSYEDIIKLPAIDLGQAEENLALLAELFNINGDFYSEEKKLQRAYDCHLKALNLFLYIYLKTTTFNYDDDEYISKIDKVIDKLSDYALPLDTEIMIFNFRNKSCRYSLAENVLFDILEREQSREIMNMAVDFYNELNSKPSDVLLQSGFTEEDIKIGLEDLKRFNFDL